MLNFGGAFELPPPGRFPIQVTQDQGKLPHAHGGTAIFPVETSGNQDQLGGHAKIIDERVDMAYYHQTSLQTPIIVIETVQGVRSKPLDPTHITRNYGI